MVEVVPLLRVVQRVRDVDPDRAVVLPEVVREIWPRHQVEPGEVHGAVAKPGAGAESSASGQNKPVAREPEQRRRAGTDAELPGDAVGRVTPRTHAAAVDSPEVMPGADGDAVLARIVAAAGAEEDVMIVQIPPTRARWNCASPAITFEDRITMPRLVLPGRLHVQEQLLETSSERVPGTGEGEDRGTKQAHDGDGRPEYDPRVERLPLGPRTHLPVIDRE